MNEGWFKTHRKIIENDDLMRNPNLLKLFIVLLSISDYKTGKWSGGRFQLAEFAKMKSSNTYKALKRLEKIKMVTLRSNTKFTTISISNWAKYQGDSNSNSNNKVTTSPKSSNNKVTLSKELKNNTKEIKKETDFNKYLGRKELGIKEL